CCASVIQRDFISDGHVDDANALGWSLREDLVWNLRLFGLESDVGSFAGKACQSGEPLSPAERCRVLLQNLINGWPAGNAKHFDLVWIFDRRRILRREIRHDLRTQIAVM